MLDFAPLNFALCVVLSMWVHSSLVGGWLVACLCGLVEICVGALADVPALPAPRGPVAWPSLCLPLLASGWLWSLGFLACLLKHCTRQSQTVQHCSTLQQAKHCDWKIVICKRQNPKETCDGIGRCCLSFGLVWPCSCTCSSPLGACDLAGHPMGLTTR